MHFLAAYSPNNVDYCRLPLLFYSQSLYKQDVQFLSLLLLTALEFMAKAPGASWDTSDSVSVLGADTDVIHSSEVGLMSRFCRPIDCQCSCSNALDTFKLNWLYMRISCHNYPGQNNLASQCNPDHQIMLKNP